MASLLNEYFCRLKSAIQVKRAPWEKIFFWPEIHSFFGSFVAILIIARIDKHFALNDINKVMLIGSYGAAATLVFAVPGAPLSQPWNVVFGNGISATVGVCMYKVGA
jgi:CBS domain-containing membrane protein